MHHSYGVGYAPVYDRWMRIQQQDVMYVLLHLQNQLGTMRDSVLCFQSTVPRLSIDDAALHQIKTTVLKVTQSMDEMRLCFKRVGRNPRSVAYNGPQGASYNRTQNINGMTTEIRYPHSLPPYCGLNYITTLQRNTVPPYDQQVPIQHTSKLPSTALDKKQSNDSRAHLTEKVQVQTVPLVEESAQASKDAPNISNGGSEAVTGSDSSNQPAETQDQHSEELLECPESNYDDVLESTHQMPNQEASESIYEQTPDELVEISEQVLDGTPVAISAHEASEYVENFHSGFVEEVAPEYLIEQPSDQIDAQESALPPYSEVVGDEVLYFYDPDQRVDSDQMVEVSNTELALAETFATASQASHQQPGISTEQAGEANDDYDAVINLNSFSTEVGIISEETACESALNSEAYPGIEHDLNVDPLELQIATEEHSSDAKVLGGDFETVEIDQLTAPVAETSNGEKPLQTSRYRSGQESPEFENASHDGFRSPVPSEARALCDSSVPPEYCDIDALTKSLEKLGMGEKTPTFSGKSLPVQCLPKSGKIPRSIEEFRLPRPREYVPTIVSYCADDGFFVQLMEDEKAILGLDSLISKSTRSAPLKFSEVQPGCFVLCMYDLDNRFYRAQLLKAAGDDKFEVRFIDYGNTCVASVRDMRRMPEKARCLGQHAVKCDLSEELKTKAAEIKRQLELISLEAHFLACFAPNYVDCDREAPIFTLIDIQKLDGMPILHVPPPLSLESYNTQLMVRNLELGTLGTVKLDLVEDLERKKTIAEMLSSSPNLPCKRKHVKEGSLVAYELRRARVTKCESQTRLSLELIDEYKNELTNVPLEQCSFLPLAAVNVPPAASCIVRVAKDQDMEMLNELCQSGIDIQMTVVGVDVLPLVKFSRSVNGAPEGFANADI